MSDIPTPPGEGEPDLGEIEDLVTDVETEVEATVDDDGTPIEVDEDGNPLETEPVEPEEVTPGRGGGAATPRNLRRRAQEAERERDQLRQANAATEQRLRDIEARVANDPGAAARRAEQEQQLRERMTPDEWADYRYNQGRQEFSTAIQALRNENQENFDRSSYEAAARTSPIRARYQDRVEGILRAERAVGRNPPRETIFKYLVGEDMVRKADKVAPAQRRAATVRVQGQVARPTGARGDTAPVRRAPAGDVEAEFANMRRRNIPLW